LFTSSPQSSQKWLAGRGWLAEQKTKKSRDLPSNLPGLNTPLSRLKRTPKHGGKEKAGDRPTVNANVSHLQINNKTIANDSQL
jgi:hypothetical protein